MPPNNQFNNNFNANGELNNQSPLRSNGSKTKVRIILTVIIVVALSGFTFVFRDQFGNVFNHRSSTKSSTGEAWLKQAKNITPQGWFRAEAENRSSAIDDASLGGANDIVGETKIAYKEVGSRDGHTINLVCLATESSLEECFLFERRINGEIALIARPQEFVTKNERYLQRLRTLLTTSVTKIDTETRYASLDIPSEIALGDGEVLVRPDGASLGLQEKSVFHDDITKKIVENDQYEIYQIDSTDHDTALSDMRYFLRLAFGNVVELTYRPVELSMEKYSFDNKTQGKSANSWDFYQPLNRGCSETSVAATRISNITDADLVAIGKVASGQTVYALKNKQHRLYVISYTEYKNDADSPVSFDRFLQDHALMFVKNSRGDYLAYIRDSYMPAYSCAKPVVYLYPTKTTSINVAVGANVTVSDPLYPTGGWRNVIAEPSGQLTYSGKKYDSLFWEGLGYGAYPKITHGVVVPRAEAEATIWRQLTELGLNKKESTDFMEYWASKIPNRPYVRLTWFKTAELERLAPLYITPKPDTVIRVFLDMAGFDEPIDLPLQKLSPTPRRGFTVVEWGGLTTDFAKN